MPVTLCETGRNMSNLSAREVFAANGTNYLDVTDEEIAEFIQALLQEVAIMTSFLAIPPERRKRIEEAIAVLQPIWRGAANSG